MRIARLFPVVLATVALAAAAPASAQPRGYYASSNAPSGDTYLLARLGGYVPNNDLNGFDAGIDTEIGIGHRFTPNLALEGAVGYYRSSTGNFAYNDPAYGWGTAKDTLSIVPLTASVRGILPAGRLELSALAGLGLYFVDMHSTTSYPGYYADSASSGDTLLGMHLGVGAAFRVTREVSLGLDVRYVFAPDATFFGTDTNVDGFRVNGVVAYSF